MNPNIAKNTNLLTFPQSGLDDATVAAFEEIRRRRFEPFAVFGVSRSERIACGFTIRGEEIDMSGHTSDYTVVLVAGTPELSESALMGSPILSDVAHLIPARIGRYPVRQVGVYGFEVSATLLNQGFYSR